MQNNNSLGIIELEEGETISPSPSPPKPTVAATPTVAGNSKPREDKRYHLQDDSDSDTNASKDKRRKRRDSKDRRYSKHRSRSRSKSPFRTKRQYRRNDRHRSKSSSLSPPRRRSSISQHSKRETEGEGERGERRGAIAGEVYKNSDIEHRRDSTQRQKHSTSRDKRQETTDRSGTSNAALKLHTTTTVIKSISAIAPDSETPEKYKLFVVMFSKLAHANKKRGDSQTDAIFGMIDHFHALCDYILNFYYVDKSSSDQKSFKHASMAWKSLFPFTESLMVRLESQKYYELYGLCARLISLVRYYIYKRMIGSTRTLLTKQMKDQEGRSTPSSRLCIEVSESLLKEYEKAEKWYNTSEKYMSFGTMAIQFPETFRHVCIEGNLTAGITLGGEAGVSVEPMFPFTPYSSLNLAAIVSKCMLNEYVSIKKLDYLPISQPEEYLT